MGIYQDKPICGLAIKTFDEARQEYHNPNMKARIPHVAREVRRAYTGETLGQTPVISGR
jgi:hypothetical protein